MVVTTHIEVEHVAFCNTCMIYLRAHAREMTRASQLTLRKGGLRAVLLYLLLVEGIFPGERQTAGAVGVVAGH
jgi:hypothetical protein